MSGRWSSSCASVDTGSVHYSGEVIGNLIPDTIVDDLVIADPKVVDSFNETHVRQMIGYLAITKLKLALLLNFKHAKLEWKRIVRETHD